MSFYGEEKWENVVKFRDYFDECRIKAEGAKQSCFYVAKRFMNQELERLGLKEGDKISLDGDILLIKKVATSLENYEPIVVCRPFTENGNPSKTETVDVYLRGIKDARKVKGE